jgi:hypothetical protein
MKFDYGPMALHEKNAKENGDLYTCGDRAESEQVVPSSKGKVIDLVLPIIVLIVICVFALVYVGGLLDGAGFIDAFSNTDATVGLPWGGLVALVITIIYMVARRVMTFKEAMDCVPKGFIAMVPAITILTLATSLKNMTGLLGADAYVAGLMDGAAAGLANVTLSAYDKLEVVCLAGMSFSDVAEAQGDATAVESFKGYAKAVYDKDGQEIIFNTETGLIKTVTVYPTMYVTGGGDNPLTAVVEPTYYGSTLNTMNFTKLRADVTVYIKGQTYEAIVDLDTAAYDDFAGCQATVYDTDGNRLVFNENGVLIQVFAPGNDTPIYEGTENNSGSGEGSGSGSGEPAPGPQFPFIG